MDPLEENRRLGKSMREVPPPLMPSQGPSVSRVLCEGSDNEVGAEVEQLSLRTTR